MAQKKKAAKKKTAPKRKKATKKKAAPKKKKATKKKAAPKKKKVTSSVSKATKKTTRPKPSTKTSQPSFGEEIAHFVTHIESLAKAIEPTMKTMSDLCEKSLNSLEAFIKSKGVIRIEKDETESFLIKPPDLHPFEKRIKALSSSLLAVINIPPIFFCDLIHKYDAYLGCLLRVAFLVKPELLSASQKSITFADFVGFKSLRDAKKSIIDKEVESVIRDSHVEQIKWMENRFKLNLRTDLDVWPDFVEITERRNLFVHSDGIVSSQYIKICKQHGVKSGTDIKVGYKLVADPTYFREAFDTIFEIGVKLGHVLWRKLQPADKKNADKALHMIGYELLTEERYELSKKILHFTTDIFKKTSSDELQRMSLINLCIAYKFSGNKQKCNELIDSEDWTACAPDFRMAIAVLKDKYADAVKIMKSIGAKGEVGREEYSTWPLFKKFRTTKEFLDAYHSLFGEEFILSKDN